MYECPPPWANPVVGKSLDACHTFAILHYMNVVMDADCLIKLTKAQVKESVCSTFCIAIPSEVRRENSM